MTRQQQEWLSLADKDGRLPNFWPSGIAGDSYRRTVRRDLIERCIVAGWAQRDNLGYAITQWGRLACDECGDAVDRRKPV